MVMAGAANRTHLDSHRGVPPEPLIHHTAVTHAQTPGHWDATLIQGVLRLPLEGGDAPGGGGAPCGGVGGGLGGLRGLVVIVGIEEPLENLVAVVAVGLLLQVLRAGEGSSSGGGGGQSNVGAGLFDYPQ